MDITPIQFNHYAHYLKPRPRDWHKGLSGHVCIVGGDLGFSGAPRMAAEAALRVGAGLVTIATRPEHAAIMNANCPEIMVHGITEVDALAKLIEKTNVVVLGPGLGQSDWSWSMWNYVYGLKKQLSLVIDADGLNLLAQKKNVLTKKISEHWVLTPHPAEAARLLQQNTLDIQTDRLRAITTLQKKYGGVCVLKGAGSLVLAPQTSLMICEQGNPGMATAGMGDVLSGVIGGLIAQGIPLADATALGVCVHAIAGDRAAKAGGERGLIATDLMPHLRAVVNPT